jgi:hypothetical protein
MSKPLLNINDPQPIKPGGAYFMMGFEPQVIGARNQLRQNWQVNFSLNSQSHANWANLQIIRDICSKVEQAEDMFYAIGGKYISRHKSLSPSSESYGAIIHTINDDGDINYCNYPGIVNTETGNMLYTSEQNLGMAYYGTNTGNNFTNKIVDTAGRNLSALNGLTVINLKDMATATITSVTDANATGDQLNFTGNWSGGADIDDGDEWVVFVDTFKDLNTAAYPHFSGQSTYYLWSRQILNFYGDYFIGHGNYLAKLSNDESTFDEDYTKLPSFMQFQAMDDNGSLILIGGELYGKGCLCLWDGETQSKYLKTSYLPAPVYSVKKYGSGWLVLAGSALYYTDGYSSKLLSNMPGTEGDRKLDASHSSMLVDGNYALISGGMGGYAVGKVGIWVYDIANNSWTYNPFENSSSKKQMYSLNGGGVFNLSDSGYNRILAGYYDGSYNSIATIYKHGDNDFSIAVFSYNAPKNTKINLVELVLGQTMDTEASTVPGATVTVALSDGRKPFWMYGAANDTAANYNEIPINGTVSSYNEASVGDLVLILNGASGGEYAFITSITGAGTASEVWVLDRNLTTKVLSGDDFQIINCKKTGEHTISDYIDQPLMFEDGLMVSGDFYLIIIIKNTSGALDIRDIALY